MRSLSVMLLIVFALSRLVMACSFPHKAGSPVVIQGGGGHGNPYPVISQRRFTRVWTGFKKCNNSNDETPSKITITSKDSMELYVSGFINAGDKIEGKTRGYTVLISLQRAGSGKRENTIEGTFDLSNDGNTLRAFLVSHINGHRDSCSAVYHPEP